VGIPSIPSERRKRPSLEEKKKAFIFILSVFFLKFPCRLHTLASPPPAMLSVSTLARAVQSVVRPENGIGSEHVLWAACCLAVGAPACGSALQSFGVNPDEVLRVLETLPHLQGADRGACAALVAALVAAHPGGTSGGMLTATSASGADGGDGGAGAGWRGGPRRATLTDDGPLVMTVALQRVQRTVAALTALAAASRPEDGGKDGDHAPQSLCCLLVAAILLEDCVARDALALAVANTAAADAAAADAAAADAAASTSASLVGGLPAAPPGPGLPGLTPRAAALAGGVDGASALDTWPDEQWQRLVGSHRRWVLQDLASLGWRHQEVTPLGARPTPPLPPLRPSGGWPRCLAVGVPPPPYPTPP
jgi:hypothetical protein